MAQPSPLLRAQLLAEMHERHDQAIRAAMAASPPEMKKAGIVIVAGGGQAFTYAWVALTNLRDVQRSQLPIQMWHLGPDELSPTHDGGAATRITPSSAVMTLTPVV